jgi:hypothetical protein
MPLKLIQKLRSINKKAIVPYMAFKIVREIIKKKFSLSRVIPSTKIIL